ncbi:MAG: hypothetical protein H0V83_00600 [Rubrobacter sp.]|nr:hypothetical protein [Rubrobacter sp.]
MPFQVHGSVGRRLVHVVYIAPDLARQVHERKVITLDEVGETGDLHVRDVRRALPGNERRQELVVHLLVGEDPEVDLHLPVLLLPGIGLEGRPRQIRPSLVESPELE